MGRLSARCCGPAASVVGACWRFDLLDSLGQPGVGCLVSRSLFVLWALFAMLDIAWRRRPYSRVADALGPAVVAPIQHACCVSLPSGSVVGPFGSRKVVDTGSTSAISAGEPDRMRRLPSRL